MEEGMEGHGDHWAPFGVPETVVPDALTLAVQGTGGDVFVGPSLRSGNGTEAATEDAVFSLANPDTDLRPLALLVLSRQDGRNRVWSAYPFARRGVEHRLVLERIEVWENGLEARLQARFNGSALVGFFDTLYHVHRERYEPGREYAFVLAGLAYSLEVGRPDPIRFTDPEMIERHREELREIGEELPLAADGALELPFDGAAILLPLQDRDIDEYEFQAPAREVVTFRCGKWTVHAIRATVMIVGDCEFDLIIYAPEPVLHGPVPKPGDDIRGKVWLQGYLADGTRTAARPPAGSGGAPPP